MTYLPCPLRRRSIGPLPLVSLFLSLEVGKSLLVDSDRPVEWSGVDLLLPSGIDGRTDGRRDVALDQRRKSRKTKMEIILQRYLP